jgi:hypothetical protein
MIESKLGKFIIKQFVDMVVEEISKLKNDALYK